MEKFCLISDNRFTNDYELYNLSFATILFQELSRSKETSFLLPVCTFKSGNRSSNKVLDQ